MKVTDEEWRSVRGYEGIYEVSSLGRVRSLDRIDSRGWRRKGRIISPAARPAGHLFVGLHSGGSQRTASVHRLVAIAFLGDPPHGMECCHTDGNPRNNHVTNLRWDTRSENQLDRVRHGTHHAVNKTTCPRGHALLHPNLVPSTLKHGFRSCLACKRTSTYCNKRGLPFDVEMANENYRRITECV